MVGRGLLIHTLAGSLGAWGGRRNRSGRAAKASSRTLLAAGPDGPGGAVVDSGGGVQADPGMAVLSEAYPKLSLKKYSPTAAR